ncbi:carbohydrate ABC transporter permease [Microbacterium sp. ASV49]|uniref:Carbohydrate ABC transporter permease n=1 Tax=Microbacterium candidum TaxID=3041922 RepID=A0ABT7MUK7_9MICO|nr:carbohydrate ABC transporter permease [Microbacterium sp. ASV49]MDL9978134.1 carbohydrate ABC transporter permease [Microbacterium sp. ASV49]
MTTVTKPRPAVASPTRTTSARTGGPGRTGKNRGFGVDRRPGWFSYTLIAVFFIAGAYPLYWTFIMGSSDKSALTDPWPPLLPGGQFWKNVAVVFDTVPFWQALANSIIVSTVVAASVVFFSTLAGYAFAKLRFRGREGLMVFVIATLAVPTQLGIIPLFMLMKQLGWTGTLGAIIIPSLVTAFGVFFMRQYLVDVIPDELIEAARVDGASMISTFWHVGVPAARPAMAILALFTFMTAWTDYLWPLLVSPQNPTLQVALSQLQSAKYVDYAVVLAGAVLATLPLLVVFILAGKQLVSGIMAGAVKG